MSGKPSKTVQLLRKRLRQLLRVIVVLAACIAVAATALAIWWLTSLNGLPDIGDPFDVAAFRTFSLPDDQNAFTFFRRAWKAIKPIYGGGWSETNPEFRAFVEANRPAVELIIKGAEQVDGISGPVGEPLPGENNSDLASAYPLQASSWGLIGMTLMEGGLREERGDMAGAWDCYRAVLRMTVHVRRRERLKDRVRVTLWLPVLQKHLATWAADPRTTIHQVRRALEEVVACRPMPEWDAFTLKIEYLDLMRFLDRRVVPPPEQIEEEWTYRLGEMQLPIDLSRDLYQVKRGLAASPNAAGVSFDCSSPTGSRTWSTPGNASRRHERASTSQSRRAACRCITSALTRRRALARCRRRRWQVGWSRPTTPSWRSGLGSWRGLTFAGGNSAVIENGSYCWLERSIAASAAHCRLPTKPWSGPISRACPTTARPTWPMR